MTGLSGTGHRVLARAARRALSGPNAPPGACVATSVGGQVQWSAGGVAQAFDDDGLLPHPPPMDLHTRTDIGSVTKVVGTTAAVMRLVDTGALRLTDTVGGIEPALAGTPVGAADVQQLLEHRAGLWEWWPTYLEPGDPMAVVAGLPLRHRPGTGRYYSDLGFLLLGRLVTAITGQPVAAAVRALVLEPLGLLHTTYSHPAPGAAVAASSVGDRIELDMVRTGRPYPVTADPARFPDWRQHVLVGEVNDGNAFHSFGAAAGHAGLFSTAADLLGFGDAMLAGLRGDGLISRPTTRLFLHTGELTEQALGFRRWPTAGGTAYGHTGFPGVALAVLPEQKRTVVLVTNRLHVSGAPVPTEPLWTDVLTLLSGGER